MSHDRNLRALLARVTTSPYGATSRFAPLCYNRIMLHGTAATIASIAFIGAASAVLLLRADPEYVTVTTDGGGLTVTGFAREGGVTITDGFGDAGDEHTVASGAVDHTLPLQLRFVSPSGPAWTGAERFDILWYDDASKMWEWQNADVVDDDYLVLRTTKLGRFAVADRQTIDAPDFVSTFDALRAQAPDGTVGYSIEVGYRVGALPAIIRLDYSAQQGGCGGAVQPGEETAYGAMTRTANVLVNDVQTSVEFTFLATWYVRPGDSCPDGQPFRAADGYGILPSSL